MQHRTLEEYKEEVFDKLDEQTKLEWLYEMSEKLCNIEEYIKGHTNNLAEYLDVYEAKELLNILTGGDEE